MDILSICALLEPPPQVARIPLSRPEISLLCAAQSPKRRREIDISRRLMRHGLRHGLKIPEHHLVWGDKGPVYLGATRDVGLSLSHSRGYAAVGLSNAGAIGVDIECNERHRPWQRMMRSMFCADDQNWVAGDAAEPGNEGTLERFLALWTAREAYAKFRRESVLARLSRPLFAECRVEADHLSLPNRTWVAVFPGPSWTAAVCRQRRKGSRPDEITELQASGVVSPLRARYLFRVLEHS
jgi:phosphopantetheinyl transferase